MIRTQSHISARITDLSMEYEGHADRLDFPNADVTMAKILELTDVLVILEAELDGFKPKHNEYRI